MTKTVQEQNEGLRDHMLSLANTAAWSESVALSQADIARALESAETANIREVILVAHGTSLATSQVIETWLAHIAQIPARSLPAFQFAHYHDRYLLAPEQTLVIGVSCSGNTKSVVGALTAARNAGADTMIMTGRQDCDGARIAAHKVSSHADIERAVDVAAYSVSHCYIMAAGFELALGLAQAHGTITEEGAREWREGFSSTLDAMSLLPGLFDEMGRVVNALGDRVRSSFAVVGTGPNEGTTFEGALKIAEFSWVFGAAEELEDFAHGRFREVDSSNPLLIIAPSGPAVTKTLDVLAGCQIAGATTVLFTDSDNEALAKFSTHIVHMPTLADEYLTPLLYVFPMWFYGWHVMNNAGGLVGDKRHGLFAADVDFSRHFNNDGSRK